MTISQMHTAVKLGLDKTEGLTYPAFEPEELDHWINEAIDRFIKTRYSGINSKQEAFEQSQKRVEDLRTLVKEARIAGGSVQTGNTDKPYSYTIPIASFPVDYMLFLNDEVLITPVASPSTPIRTYTAPCTSDTYSALISDPYSEHRLHLDTARPLRMFTSKGVELITDGQYAITYYYMKYICKPTVVAIGTSTDCDLPDHTHREVVLLTVKILTENIESPRYQTESIELTQNE